MSTGTVLVTGAGSGLGQAAALHLASRGWRVYGTVLHDGESAALAGAAAAQSVPVTAVPMDVTSDAQVRAGVARVLEGGRLDAVVSFAGLGLRGFFEDLSLDEVRRVFDVNVYGAMRLAWAVLPHMRAAGAGRLVFVTSIAGRMGSMSISGYASSKFAVEGWAECLAQEVAPHGVHVSLLEPGLVATPHFTVNRNRAARALDPSGVYHAWFCRHEALVDDLLRRNRFGPADVARTVERVLTARRPRLRYVVGGKARLVLALRRHVPGEWFERVYFGALQRLIVRATGPVPPLSGLKAGTPMTGSAARR